MLNIKSFFEKISLLITRENQQEFASTNLPDKDATHNRSISLIITHIKKEQKNLIEQYKADYYMSTSLFGSYIPPDILDSKIKEISQNYDAQIGFLRKIDSVMLELDDLQHKVSTNKMGDAFDFIEKVNSLSNDLFKLLVLEDNTTRAGNLQELIEKFCQLNASLYPLEQEQDSSTSMLGDLMDF
jgi:hypothetical protein